MDEGLAKSLNELSLKKPNQENEVLIKNTVGTISMQIYMDHEEKIQKMEFTSQRASETRTITRKELFGSPEVKKTVTIEVSESPDNELQIEVKRPVTIYDLLHKGCIIQSSDFDGNKQHPQTPNQIQDLLFFKYTPIDKTDVDHTSPPPCCSSCGADPSSLDDLRCEICLAREASYDMVACTADQHGPEQGLPENAAQK